MIRGQRSTTPGTAKKIARILEPEGNPGLSTDLCRQELTRNRVDGGSSLDRSPSTCQNSDSGSLFTPVFDDNSMDSHTAPVASDDVFQAADVEFFTAEDTVAGQAICKMLSLMFAYTVCAMTVTTLVTIYWTRR